MSFLCLFQNRKFSVFCRRVLYSVIIILTQSAFSQTEVAGEVSGVWDPDGSPYIAIEAITIPAGEQLIIEPGVEVRFEEHFPLVVNGVLRAIGTEEDSIWFITNRWREDIRWGGIQFSEAEDGCEMAFSHISTAGWNGAPQTVRGILIYRSSPTIRNSLISNCASGNNSAGGIWVWWAPEAIIENNTLEDNDGGAIWCSGEGITRITGNLIRENTGYGIDAYSKATTFIQNNQVIDNGSTGLILRNTLSIVEDNTISNNARGGISSSCARTVIKGNVISGNTIDVFRGPNTGGGILVSGNAIICGNLIFSNNAGATSGGVHLGGEGQVHFYNNVVYDNFAGENYGGVFASRSCRHNIQNCIIWNNQGNEVNREHANIGFSNVEQNFEAEGMLRENPLFIDPENGDFRLAEDSPCINTGNDFPMYNDADGSRNNMGAFGGNDLLFGFTTNIEFPDIGYYAHTESNLALCNLNEEAVTISRISLTDRDNFSVVGETPLDLPPSQWIDFPVTFNPQEAGEFEEFFSLNFEDFELFNRALFTVTGTALDGVTGNVHGLWTREMSPINVIGNARVPDFDTLRIEPGVVVTLEPECRLTTDNAYGALYAIGTVEDSILFTSAQREPEPGDWRKLDFRGRAEYCIVEFSEWGIILEDGEIANSTFRNNSRTGAIVNTRWQPGRMRNCLIENCARGVAIDGRATLETSVIIGCESAIQSSQGGTAYRNLFAFNEEVEVARLSWIDFGGGQIFSWINMNTIGNIFYRNDRISTHNRPHPAFRYNCVFDSPIEEEDLLLGQLDFNNLNGTPCDENFNIIVNPQLLNPDEFDFHLTENSPCINAGNPYWDRDQDGSWADMGAFEFTREDGNPLISPEPEFIEVEGDDEQVLNLSNLGDGRLFWRTDIGADWVTCEPRFGIIENEGDSDVFLIIQNPEFGPGIYETELIFDSNDPENPLLSIPITLRIGGENIRALDVSMFEGWNLISLNIDPLNCYAEGGEQGPDIILMFAQIVENTIIVKDEQGRFYAPEFEFNNIPFWNLTEGYLVKTNSELETSWSGEIIPADSNIPLTEGWNYAAYFPTFHLDASAPDYHVLSPIIENVIIAKDESGRFLAPEFDFSNMLPWRESKGYQIRVDEDVVLNYPEGGEEVEFTPTALADAPVCQLTQGMMPTPTGQNMSLLITYVTDFEVGNGDFIIAIDFNGNVVGVGNTGADGRCGLAIWGDDKTTEQKEGLNEGEGFTLRYWNSQQDLSFDLEIAIGQIGSGFEYEPDGFIAFSTPLKPTIPDNYYLSQNYPNPFNSSTKLLYGLPEAGEISLKVFDTSGREIEKLIYGAQSAGHHSVIWIASDMSSGVYLVKMQSNRFKSTRKVVLVR